MAVVTDTEPSLLGAFYGLMLTLAMGCVPITAVVGKLFSPAIVDSVTVVVGWVIGTGVGSVDAVVDRLSHWT